MRVPLAILAAAIWTQGAFAARSEQDLHLKHVRFAARFNATYKDPIKSAEAIDRIKALMQTYEQNVPTKSKGSLRAVCGELDMMNAAIGR